MSRKLDAGHCGTMSSVASVPSSFRLLALAAAVGLFVACLEVPPMHSGGFGASGAETEGDPTAGMPDATTTEADPGNTSDPDPTGDSSGGPTDEPTTGDPDDGSTGGGGPAIECDGSGLGTGRHEDLSLLHDGIMRRFDVYIPEGYRPDAPTPMVVDFHGLGSSSTQQAANSRLDEVADERGMIVVWPQGVDDAWNGGSCCNDDVDDLGFVLALVQELETLACVDPARIYATGMSNGGIMSHRLGCEAADTFAAIAPVAGMMLVSASHCQPSRGVPVLAFHGSEDSIVPYSAAQDATQKWIARNECSTMPVETYANGDVKCQTYPNCRDDVEVTLCSVEGGGHCWPGRYFCAFGSGTNDIDATTAMADFFELWSL
jgi:polyhydroxybutyrate depolymerase